MEPWDGPASIAFTDGSMIGAVLDRNGLRPSRANVTKDDLVIMASEVGVLDIPPEDVLVKERLHPGKIFLVDTTKGRIVDDEEIKGELAAQHPYAEWLKQHIVGHQRSAAGARGTARAPDRVQPPAGVRLHAGGPAVLIAPMAANGEEPLGSMGTDSALAVLSQPPAGCSRLFQAALCAGHEPAARRHPRGAGHRHGVDDRPERNLLKPEPESCLQITIKPPIIHNEHLAKLRHLPPSSPFRSTTLSMLFDPEFDPEKAPDMGGAGLEKAMADLCRRASEAVAAGFNILILSDRGVGPKMAPIPSLLATGGRAPSSGARRHAHRCALVVESGDAREVHHVSLLLGYGAGVVNPYVAFETSTT